MTLALTAPLMLLSLGFSSLALAAPLEDEPAAGPPLPELRIQRRGDLGVLSLVEPDGEHLAEEAPANLWIHIIRGERSAHDDEDGERGVPPSTAEESAFEIASNGASISSGVGLALGSSGPLSVHGEITASLCAEVGSTCRVVQMSFKGNLSRGRGSVLLDVAPLLEDTEEEKATQSVQAPLAPDDAFRRASKDGRLVLLDFYATWCPPCNQLSSLILDDPADAPIMEAFWISRVDVDTTESWKLKNRYKVAGYPTMVVTTSDGVEVDRMEGFNSESEASMWLRSVVQGMEPIDELAERVLRAGPPLSATEAAMATRRLAAAGRERAARAAMVGAGESVEKHIAMLILDQQKDEVLWLSVHGANDLLEWIWFVPRPAMKDPKVFSALRALVQRTINSTDPATASELLSLLASASEGDESKLYTSLAAALMHAALSGDPAQDRGYWTSLAHLYQQSGDTDRAVALLKRATSAFPNEFTFHFALGQVLKDAGRPEQALSAAQSALTTSYGDMTLRAAILCAEILADMDRKDEALKLLDAVEAKTPRPDPGLEVRTHRYLNELEKKRQELQKKP